LRPELRKEFRQADHVNSGEVYYTLTLDPIIKDHRIIALIIDHTSPLGECQFYRLDDSEKPCRIAPKFKVMWRDCGGRCFVDGLTCSMILDYLEDLNESKSNCSPSDADDQSS
jgi:hypothetical protein